MNVTIAGIKRSGSTAQYNMARLIMMQKWQNINISGHVWNISDDMPNLIKRHKFNQGLYKVSHLVLLTDRNDREIINSLSRLENRDVSHDDIGMMRINLDMWRKHKNHLEQHFNKIKNNPKECILEIAERMNISINIDDVYDSFMNIKPPDDGYDSLTMLFHNHISK